VPYPLCNRPSMTCHPQLVNHRFAIELSPSC
jgi:hypothetical protein